MFFWEAQRACHRSSLLVPRARACAHARALHFGFNDLVNRLTVTLHAASPRSLADPLLAELVRACVEETAEHQGVAAPSVELFDDHIEVSAQVPMPILLAIAGEVRKATGRWHRNKYGVALWQGE